MKTSCETKINFSDMNQESMLGFGNMIDIMQDCMNVQSESINRGVEYQLETRRVWVLSSWQIEIHGHFNLNEEIVATTWPYYFKGAAGKRNSVIARKDAPDDFIIKANSVWAMFDAAKGTLSRIMQDDVAPYECEEPLDMDYIKSKIKRADSYEKQDTFTVRNYHMDFNRHMNNAWHLRIAEEYVTDHMKVKKVRIEYKMQAVLGDCMIAYVARESGRTVVELRNSEDELFSITEFDY
ncbi:MAG: hypothetical protein IIT48_01210 [Lachnospiraceae bacterium]|nr:hypothetical protein [Lachnospiraceae bacterium]